MAAPLYLHIGLQKTGTSYLQTIFWASQDRLSAAGLELVPGSKRETFGLMLDVRNRVNPELDPPSYATAVQRLPGMLSACADRRVLISQESLASSTDEQVERLLAACADREVHVVVTVRDLARQIPSAWQEEVKSGRTMTLDRYVERLRQTEDRSGRLWKQKDVIGVLERWGRHVPPERIHVVTVPPSGSPGTLLLERFCSVLDLDPAVLDVDSAGRGNPGLGTAQVEVLRRVNEQLPDRLRRRVPYGDIGKRMFAMRVLALQDGRRILLDETHREWCDQVSREFAEHIGSGGYALVGSLDDLAPSASSFAPDAADASDKEMLDVAVSALAGVLGILMRERLERRRGETRRGERPLVASVGRLARFRGRLRRG